MIIFRSFGLGASFYIFETGVIALWANVYSGGKRSAFRIGPRSNRFPTGKIENKAVTIKLARESTMRAILLAAIAVAAFSTTMTIKTTDANAVVCARGVYRAGCVAPGHGAAVVRPAAACRYVIVNGVRVRRCV